MSAPCSLCQDGVDYRYGDVEVLCGGSGVIDRPHEEDDMAEAIAEEQFWSRAAVVEGPR